MADETLEAARTILGCIENGALVQSAYAREHLTTIIKQWLLLAERSPDELAQVEPIYNALTPMERKVMRVLLSLNRLTFDELMTAWECRVTEDAIEKVLKGIRKKLDRDQWWFSVSRSTYEVVWTKRAGKNI